MDDIRIKAVHGKTVQLFIISEHGDIFRIKSGEILISEIYFCEHEWIQISGDIISTRLLKSFGQVIEQMGNK